MLQQLGYETYDCRNRAMLNRFPQYLVYCNSVFMHHIMLESREGRVVARHQNEELMVSRWYQAWNSWTRTRCFWGEEQPRTFTALITKGASGFHFTDERNLLCKWEFKSTLAVYRCLPKFEHWYHAGPRSGLGGRNTFVGLVP